MAIYKTAKGYYRRLSPPPKSESTSFFFQIFENNKIMWAVSKLLQVTLHVANGHSFVNAMLFLVLHRGLRQAAADACCNSMSAVGRWLTAGWSPEPYTLDAVMPGASPEPVLAAPPPPPPTSLPAYTIRHTSMRVSEKILLLFLDIMNKSRDEKQMDSLEKNNFGF